MPTEWGLGFAGVLALLGVTYSLLSDKKSWIAAGVAACAAVAAFGLPLKLNIVVAIAAGVAIGLAARPLVSRRCAGAGLMSQWYMPAGIVGLAVVTVMTRGFFLLSDRELELPRVGDAGPALRADRGARGRHLAGDRA